MTKQKNVELAKLHAFLECITKHDDMDIIEFTDTRVTKRCNVCGKIYRYDRMMNDFIEAVECSAIQAQIAGDSPHNFEKYIAFAILDDD